MNQQNGSQKNQGFKLAVGLSVGVVLFFMYSAFLAVMHDEGRLPQGRRPNGSIIPEEVQPADEKPKLKPLMPVPKLFESYDTGALIPIKIDAVRVKDGVEEKISVTVQYHPGDMWSNYTPVPAHWGEEPPPPPCWVKATDDGKGSRIDLGVVFKDERTTEFKGDLVREGDHWRLKDAEYKGASSEFSKPD